MYFKDKPYLNARSENSFVVDYSGITSEFSTLRMDVFFESSGPITIEWHLNNEKLNVDEELNSTQANKYVSDCIHSHLFSYNCFLVNDYYSQKDVGTYESVIRLKEYPEISLRLNVSAIMPSKFLSNY